MASTLAIHLPRNNHISMVSFNCFHFSLVLSSTYRCLIYSRTLRVLALSRDFNYWFREFLADCNPLQKFVHCLRDSHLMSRACKAQGFLVLQVSVSVICMNLLHNIQQPWSISSKRKTIPISISWIWYNLGWFRVFFEFSLKNLSYLKAMFRFCKPCLPKLLGAQL